MQRDALDNKVYTHTIRRGVLKITVGRKDLRKRTPGFVPGFNKTGKDQKQWRSRRISNLKT